MFTGRLKTEIPQALVGFFLYNLVKQAKFTFFYVKKTGFKILNNGKLLRLRLLIVMTTSSGITMILICCLSF